MRSGVMLLAAAAEEGLLTAGAGGLPAAAGCLLAAGAEGLSAAVAAVVAVAVAVAAEDPLAAAVADGDSFLLRNVNSIRKAAVF